MSDSMKNSAEEKKNKYRGPLRSLNFRHECRAHGGSIFEGRDDFAGEELGGNVGSEESVEPIIGWVRMKVRVDSVLLFPVRSRFTSVVRLLKK